MVKKATPRFWAPSRETVDAMGQALCDHWVATHAVPESPYWPRPVSWLHRQARLAAALLDRRLTI